MIRSLFHLFGWCLLAAMIVGYFVGHPPTESYKPIVREDGTVIAHLHDHRLIVKPLDHKDVVLQVSVQRYLQLKDGDSVLLEKPDPNHYILSVP